MDTSNVIDSMCELVEVFRDAIMCFDDTTKIRCANEDTELIESRNTFSTYLNEIVNYIEEYVEEKDYE